MLLFLLACWRSDRVASDDVPGDSAAPFDTDLGCVEDPYPASLTDVDLDSTWGRFAWTARDDVTQTATTYRPTTWDGDRVLFVVHGSTRDVEGYLDAFAPVGERHGALVVLPHWTEQDYATTEDWTLGVGLFGTPYGEGYHEGEWRDPHDYTLSEIEHVYEALRTELGLPGCRYDIVGHSAGAQFVHRLATFRPDARFGQAIAANSGWYTLPTRMVGMPYGLLGSPVDGAHHKLLLSRDLMLLLGELDTQSAGDDEALRDTPEANAQGDNRLERGKYALGVALKQAQDLDIQTGWGAVEVPLAGHDKDEMAQSAGNLLYSTACAPSDAGTIAFTEVLADPPDDLPGDANGDGVRDTYDDEFIELRNVGDTDMCLTGWQLQESHLGRTHVFPVGSVLRAGQAVVVFGDGVPTGEFGGATVQWAAHANELDLQNDGDHVRLLNGAGDPVVAFSWGDCGEGGVCALDHWDGKLNLNQSVTRTDDGTWVPHGAVSSALYSPGAQSDGSPW